MVDVPAPLFEVQQDQGTSEVGTDRSATAEREDGLVIRTGKAIRTLGDAVEHINTIMDRQIDAAVDQNAPVNEAIRGDAPARTTFYTLLPDPQQRQVFLRVANQVRAWPRLRPLFGAPPFGFLRNEDAGILRAAGIASNRSNMTHEEFQSAASYSQFGAGQLYDELAREYRVIRRQNVSDTDPLPCNFDVRDKPDMLLQVRLRRRTREKKLEMMRDVTQRDQLNFPRPGDRIILKETKRILQIQGKRPDSAVATTLLVKRVVPRSLGSATAALIAIIS